MTKFNIVAVGNGYWGRGKTIDEAREERRRVGGSGKCALYLVVWAPHEGDDGKAEAFVDDLGRIVSPGPMQICEPIN